MVRRTKQPSAHNISSSKNSDDDDEHDENKEDIIGSKDDDNRKQQKGRSGKRLSLLDLEEEFLGLQ